MEQLIRKGKVKEVYARDGFLRFHFTDSISVFDRVIPTEIPGKGEILCNLSARWFEKTSDIARNHFITLLSPKDMLVRRFDVLDRPTVDDSNYLIPLEFIVRHYVSGSLYDRLVKGVISPENLGLDEVRYGARLPSPLFEITTKFEEHDRRVDLEEAMRIGGLTVDDITAIRAICLAIDDVLEKEARKGGLIHVDGKKEFAFDEDRRPVLVDTFGTPDEDRFWDLEAYEEGRFVELSKERVRQHYREIGFHEKLMEARERGEPEPDIPPLPEEIVDEVAALYREIYRRLTGEEYG